MDEPRHSAGELFADRYEIIREAGRGGMGTVDLVYDHKHQREIALKKLHRDLLGKPWITARFAREARITRTLDHPGVVQLHGAYKHGDDLFYTMEFIPGRNLRSYLTKVGAMDLASVVHVLGLLARALDYTHRFTIHRDVSPENVMVMPDGAIKLIDFGLTRPNNDTDRMTLANSSLGKIEYHAPEQGLDAASVDQRADLYPLGVMFFEMLTHERPDGELHITKFRPDLPHSSDAFVRHALAKDPADRFPSARAFHDALLHLYEESKQPPEGGPPGRRKGFMALGKAFRALRRVLKRRK